MGKIKRANMADYYQLLGLKTKDPSEDALKKAYKKAALKHHPDKNPNDRDAAEKRFKRVAEAYAVLSDPEKKHVYDQYGEEGLKQGPPPSAQGGNPFQGGMPNGMFFQQGGQGGGFPGGRSFVFTSGSDGMSGGGLGGIDAHDLFAQLFGGDMGGMGGFEGLGRMPAPKRNRQSTHWMSHNKPDAVTHELGCTLEQLYNGATRKLKVTRELVDGASGAPVKAEKVLEVNVQPGWKQGTKIRFKGEGDERPGKAAQDVVFVVKEKPHSYLERRGDDLHYHAKITQEQAAKGVKVTIPTLDGRKVVLDRKGEVIKDGAKAPLVGEGMPTKSGAKGDLFVHFKVASVA